MTSSQRPRRRCRYGDRGVRAVFRARRTTLRIAANRQALDLARGGAVESRFADRLVVYVARLRIRSRAAVHRADRRRLALSGSGAARVAFGIVVLLHLLASAPISFSTSLRGRGAWTGSSNTRRRFRTRARTRRSPSASTCCGRSSSAAATCRPAFAGPRRAAARLPWRSGSSGRAWRSAPITLTDLLGGALWALAVIAAGLSRLSNKGPFAARRGARRVRAEETRPLH